MKAGALDQRVALQSPTLAENSAGETTATFATVRTVWAEVKPLKAWQIERSKQVEMNATHLVRIRYAADVRGDWRIVWRSKTLNIVALVNPNSANVELELSCEEQGVLTA